MACPYLHAECPVCFARTCGECVFCKIHEQMAVERQGLLTRVAARG